MRLLLHFLSFSVSVENGGSKGTVSACISNGRKEDARRLLSQVQQPHPHCVHWAADHGWQDLCRQLVENYNLSPSDEADIFGDGSMYRPLHRACIKAEWKWSSIYLPYHKSYSLSMSVVVVVVV